MLVYPQLPSGALSQFPVQRRHAHRTLVNTAADGSVIKLADAGAEMVEWQLNYAALSDGELANLQQFFLAAEGTLNSFTFVDPLGNLFAWSNDLGNEFWDSGRFLSLTGAVADPVGGGDGWLVANSGAAAQELTQTVTAPGGYFYCLSMYAKAAAPATLTLLLGSSRYPQNLSQSWQRFACTGTADATASSMTFGFELGAGGAIDVYGLQVEPQPNPSLYKASTTGGCYENARLRDDTLSFTTVDVNCHAATVNILHASNL